MIFVQFEKSALAESENVDNANRELALFYLHHAKRPVAALRIAELEASRRRDTHTLQVLAEALRANGKTKAAKDIVRESEERLNASLRKPSVKGA